MSNAFLKNDAPRTTLKAFVVRALAVIGALFLLLVGIREAARFLTRNSPTGIVLGPGDAPAARVPVFLDRGHTAIERYVTDGAGRFFLPLEYHELRGAVWLICAPGGIPMVGSRTESQVGPTRYGYTPRKGSESSMYRGFGWRGPIPRECPQGTDSMGWRYPASAGTNPSAITFVEPQWDR